MKDTLHSPDVNPINRAAIGTKARIESVENEEHKLLLNETYALIEGTNVKDVTTEYITCYQSQPELFVHS